MYSSRSQFIVVSSRCVQIFRFAIATYLGLALILCTASAFAAPAAATAPAAPGAAGTGSGVGATINGDLDTIGVSGGFKPITDAKNDLPYRIGALIRGVMSVLGLIFLVLVVYAGYKWMLAHGEPGEVKEAQKLLLHSIIGLVITAAAYAITSFVINAVSSAAF